MVKIIDLIAENEKKKKPFFSFEYFPPKTAAGVANLYERVDRMGHLEPLFVDVTWGAGGSTAELTLELSANFHRMCCLETQMHLTCTNMHKDQIVNALKKCREAGIQNIIALRGDPPVGQERWEATEGGFAHAVDLVKFIRQEHGDYFGIAVAGYPEGHTESESYEKDLQHLKEKVDAGADLILTQLFYDVDQFLKFVKDCRTLGINVPIIPGIMPVNGYASWKRMTDFCKTLVPQEFRERLEAVKDDDAKVKEIGCEFVTEMCRKLLASGIQGLHMYTLNLEKSVLDILQRLGLMENAVERRELPWRARLDAKEDVRPIFWANRPRSYVARTQEWDDYPNGRWGDSRSPAFGELLDYHLFAHTPDIETKRKMWGCPKSMEEVGDRFVQFVEGKITQLPWCQNLAKETASISEDLLMMNQNGFWTINSQPRINGVSSTDAQFGWGGPGGYVYQKAYLEFFCSPQRFESMMAIINRYPQLTYAAVSAEGSVKTNSKGKGVIAVTWGVFPDKEVVQPTVADLDSFVVWREEAFALWKTWKSIYEANPEASTAATVDPQAERVLQDIHDTFYLVNIVDNDFVAGDIFGMFREIVRGK